MANYNELKASIEQQIRSNGNQEITGDILQGILLGMLDYAAGGYEESDVMYGVEWDVTDPDPAMTRIGNMSLHRQLPIQNRMKGCLLNDDGEVVEYLNPTNWNAHALDGSRGQVMVELPEHYRKFETDGNIRRCKMSEYPLPGFHCVPKMYISAYEAAVQRSTSKLASVKNMSEDYRGGNNNAEWDGTYRSLLGRPATNINRATFRIYARNRNISSHEWNCLTYGAYKAVFWLYYVEYANRNCQLAFNAERDANGYAQGGISDGVTKFNPWDAYNSYNPFISCGETDSLGNRTGIIEKDIVGGDGEIIASVSIPRYRGVENPFGHIWKILDGVIVVSNDDLSKAYVSEDPSLFTDDDISNYSEDGSVPISNGYVRQISVGEYGGIFPTEIGSSATTYWCDYYYARTAYSLTHTIARQGGFAIDGVQAGLAYMSVHVSANQQGPDTGTRLCFIPANS